MSLEKAVDFVSARRWGVVCSNEMAWSYLDSISEDVRSRVYFEMCKKHKGGQLFHTNDPYPTSEVTLNGRPLDVRFKKCPIGRGHRMVLYVSE